MLPSDLPVILANHRQRWLVTGAAGFIGSNLVEALLKAGQDVIAFDNFSTGHQRNIDEVRRGKFPATSSFELMVGDIRDREACAAAVRGVDVVLHQAALGSVPRSIADPVTSHDVNVTGMLNMLDAARLGGKPRFIYAASSSTYGDSAELPKREGVIGAPLSPYAATKLANEVYADVYGKTYGYHATGLRYFNVFGPRQDPDGAYAAVIPKWVSAMIQQKEVIINGDGQTSRDFCYVANAVQANLLAALGSEETQGGVYNVAVGQRTTLLELFALIRAALGERQIHYAREPDWADFRQGDVQHSLADISKARRDLGFDPGYTVAAGVAAAMPWYIDFFRARTESAS